MINHRITISKLSFISVIIPVYNAEKFVTRAVESALSQPETAEVILVEDGSKDNSYAVCQALNENNEKVYLYTHKEHINKGAGATRNLGIQKAHFDYIAFLDADDFYLENRFKVAKKILQSTPNADGVYEATGVWFENKSAEKFWTNVKKYKKITTIKDGIDPEDLFWEQSPVGSKGHAHLDGLTIKRSALQKVGLFNPELRLHQDSDLFMRLAMDCSLYPGEVGKPVAKRGVHANNRMTEARSIEELVDHKIKMWKSTYKWALKSGYENEAQEIKKHMYYVRIYAVSQAHDEPFSKKIKQFYLTAKSYPIVLTETRIYKSLAVFLIKPLR